ncbi:MAG: amidohydrolase [Caulobacteraceae bacterium]
MSRRMVLAAALLTGAALASPVLAQDRCAGGMTLFNGKIHTMDAKDTVVSQVAIKDGKFTRVGGLAKLAPGPCVIDLKGRTVVPGLIDNHNHFVLLGERPGHDARLEEAFSVADVQAVIKARAKTVPAGGWITAMGGWAPLQLAEKRMPTLAELDAGDSAHPVLVYTSFSGPASANTKAKEYLAAHGVAVGADGAIAANAPSLAARKALLALQTDADRERGVLDAMAYSARVGLTTNADMGEFIEPGTRDMKDSFMAETLASGDPFKMYDPFLKLHREGRLTTRLRVYFLQMDQGADFPMTRERVLNQFDRFGDDMMRVSGVGEFATSWSLFGKVEAPANYVPALKFIAAHGWAFQQHSLSLAEDQVIAQAFEEVNKETPIADLRWSDAHVPKIDEATVMRLKAVGAGIALHPFQYLPNPNQSKGPPVRMIIKSGIHVGAGSDSAQISTLNPWNMIYYLVTGLDAAGRPTNVDDTIDRQTALKLYTADNGWFLKEEDKLGSIETGKLADLVVLSGDYFDAKAVPDADIRKLHSVMTVVGGRVIYREGK